jgi:hypothetical protein
MTRFWRVFVVGAVLFALSSVLCLLMVGVIEQWISVPTSLGLRRRDGRHRQLIRPEAPWWAQECCRYLGDVRCRVGGGAGPVAAARFLDLDASPAREVVAHGKPATQETHRVSGREQRCVPPSRR